MSNLTRHLASVGPCMNSTCKLTLILANLRTLVKETGSQKISVLKWASGFGLFWVSHSVCLQKYGKFAPSVFVLIPFPSYLVLWMSVNGPPNDTSWKIRIFLENNNETNQYSIILLQQLFCLLKASSMYKSHKYHKTNFLLTHFMQAQGLN